jgi:AraC-like DNA-binding protein
MKKERIIKNEVEHVVIPASCRERFLVHPSPDLKAIDNFSIRNAGISELKLGYVTDRFPSYDHLILYCLDGEGVLVIDGKKRVMKPGQVLIVPSGNTFCYRPRSTSWRIAWVHLIECAQWDALSGMSPMVREAQCNVDIETLIESYIREKNVQRPDSQVPLRGYMELLGCYITRELGAVSPSVVRARNRLIDLWALIRVDLKHGWTVEDMASRAGMCRTSLHNICMKTDGISPKNIVVKMRMERAVELLTFTDHTLEHIAESIGYDTAFSFSRAFKGYSEVSPREFRKKISLPGESSS